MGLTLFLLTTSQMDLCTILYEVLNWIRTSCNLVMTCNQGVDDSSNSFPGFSLPTLGTRLMMLGKISISTGCRLRHRGHWASGPSKYAVVKWRESFLAL